MSESNSNELQTAVQSWFERFAAELQPDDQLPVPVSAYDISPAELRGQILAWTMQYLSSKECPEEVRGGLCRAVLREAPAAVADLLTDTGNYSPLQLMQRVMEQVNAVCLRHAAPAARAGLVRSERPLRRAAACALKNARRYMEDRHVVIPCLEELFHDPPVDEECTSVYAVYDGHGGSTAATYCAALLHTFLYDSPHFRTNLPRALTDAFRLTDKHFIAKTRYAESGSTALVVVVRGALLLAGWLGDSQAVLVKQLTIMPLVTPHTPDRQDEQKRIEALDGTVSRCFGTWRVNGVLAVSRSIGDAKFKKWVSSEPELAEVALRGDEDLLVLGSDGLWDNVPEQRVVRLLYAHLADAAARQEECDVKKLAESLASEARFGNSKDNVTVIVLLLRPSRDILTTRLATLMADQEEAIGKKWTPDANFHNPVIDRLVCGRLDGLECEEEEEEADSEDLGPETAVDGADETDEHALAARASDECGAEDNVGESGDDSEDEWNYFQGEQKQREATSEPRPPASPSRNIPAPTDRGAWEESSESEMNSSPLNPEAPVFVPTGAESPLEDRLLAESPRKPLPIHDLDSSVFSSEAHARPASPSSPISSADKNHFNGHHATELEQLVSCGQTETARELVRDMERVQRDVAQLCHLQVGFAETEMDPLDSNVDLELVERLQSKERDPMSMSFYRDEPPPELNTVQPLPDSDDDSAETHKLLLDQAPEHRSAKLDLDEPQLKLHKLELHLDDNESDLRAPEQDLYPTQSIGEPETTLSGTEQYQPEQETASSGAEIYKLEQETALSGTEQYQPEPKTASSGAIYKLEQETALSGTEQYQPEPETASSGAEIYKLEQETASSGTEQYQPKQETALSGTEQYQSEPETALPETEQYQPEPETALRGTKQYQPELEDVELKTHQPVDQDLREPEMEAAERESHEPETDLYAVEGVEESQYHTEERDPQLIESNEDLLQLESSDIKCDSPNVLIEQGDRDDVVKFEEFPVAATPQLVDLTPSPTPAPLEEETKQRGSQHILDDLLGHPTSPLRSDEFIETHTSFDTQPRPKNELAPFETQTMAAPLLCSDIDKHISAPSETELADNLAQQQIEICKQILEPDQPASAESHAQEICVPVTDEIPPTATPPPSQGAMHDPPLHETEVILVQETPIASAEPEKQNATAAVAAVTAASAVVASAATVAAKKTPLSGKKLTPVPKPSPGKTTTPAKTARPASKPATPASPAVKKSVPPVTKTPVTPKATSVLTKTPTTKPPAPKLATKLSTTTAKPATAAPRTTTATRPAPAAKTAPAAPRPVTARAAAAVPKPAAPRVPAARTVAAAAAPPKSRPAPARPATVNVAADKPLTNGDAKPAPIRRPTSATTAAKPLAPAPRPAARVPPRPTTAAAAPTKTVPRTTAKPPPATKSVSSKPVARTTPKQAVSKVVVNGGGAGAETCAGAGGAEGEPTALPDVVA